VDNLTRYIRKGRNSVKGWLSRLDAEAMATLLQAQSDRNQTGSCAEIGVLQGKSFILLALANPNQENLAIDIFDRQEFNLDRAGVGRLEKFQSNLDRFGIRHSSVEIDARPSFDVTPKDILNRVGPVRMFHIDGGHHLRAVANDLKLAEATIAPFGIVVVDDVFRPEWPEVSMGLFKHILDAQSALVPFAIGFNKTFLCLAPCSEAYRAAILSNPFLKMHLTKRYRVDSDEILVLQDYALPEWTLRQRLRWYLRMYHPDLAYWCRRFL